MLILAATTDKIEVVRSSTANIDFNAEWVDFDGVNGTPGNSNATWSTAATGDAVVAPASNVQRNIKSMTFRNRHASASNTLTVQKNLNATVREYISVILLAGETLQFNENGWSVIDNSGAVKVNYNDPRLITASLASQHDNSTTTPTEVTGITKALPVGLYIFEYYLIHQAGATTTGIKLSVDFSGTASIDYWLEHPTALSTAADANVDQTIATATGGLINLFADRAGSQAGLGVTLSCDTINVDNQAVIRGIINVTVTGNIRLWHGSEVAAITSLMPRCGLRLTKLV